MSYTVEYEGIEYKVDKLEDLIEEDDLEWQDILEIAKNNGGIINEF